jgi:RNA polymerase sigma-70 factor (ECF subfamily)
MKRQGANTDQLLDAASQGDGAARARLLDRHRQRLRQMIALRLDRRLAARIDPSDVVQEALIVADRQLDCYLRERPLPFYPWLRQIAWERLIELHRKHVRARRRSVMREEPLEAALSDESAQELIQRVLARGSSPSARLDREEQRQQIEKALEQLAERDREILVLRHLERLSTEEIAAVLGISVGAVYTRHLRALERLGNLLKIHPGEDKS